MPGLITTGNHPKALWPGVHAWFGAVYDEHKEEFPDMFEIKTSTQNYEEDVLNSAFSLAPIKPQGRGVTYVSHTQGYVSRYIHIVYASGYICTREEIEDNLYEKVAMDRARSLAFSLRQTKENVHANVWNRSTNTNFLGGDGSALMVVDHPSEAGTWSNILTPAADLSEVALEDICIQVMGAKDEKGNQINLMVESLHVPRQLWFEANRILKSVLQSNSGNNDLNVLNSTNAIPGGIKVNHYFTDTDAFFCKTNVPNGLTSFQRRAYEFVKDNDFDTENAKSKASERYSVGWTDPRTLYGSPGA